MTLFRISGSIGKKSTFTFLRLETLKSCTAHTVHFKSWYFLHPLSSLHCTYFSWLCFHPRKAVYARRSVVGLHQRINTSVWWQSEVGRRGVPAMALHVIKKYRHQSKSQVVSTPPRPFLFSVFVLCFYRSLRTAMYPEKCSRLLLVLWWRCMKPKCSWPYSQEPVTGPCSETWIVHNPISFVCDQH